MNPGEGIHKARLFGFARNDIVGTVVAAIVITLSTNVSLIHSLVGLFLLGEILHLAFGVETEVIKRLTHMVQQLINL